jgi:hypothetical protein
MPRVIQQRRGSTSGISSILGAAGELFVDTSLVTVVVHDGVTTGGTTLARNADLTNLSSVTATNLANLTSSTNSSISYLSSVAATKATNTSLGIVQGNNTSILINNGIATLGSSITASWTIAQSSNGALYFYYAGVAKFRFDSSGTITAVNDLIAVGTI